MTKCPSRALDWPRALSIPELYNKEIQGHHQVCKGPMTSSRTTDANRDGSLVESAFLFVAPAGLLGLDDLLYLDAIMTNMMKTSKRGNVTIR